MRQRRKGTIGPGEKRAVLSCYFNVRHLEQLEELSAQRHATKVELVREAVARYLTEEEERRKEKESK